jgi:hypothetical protein
MLILHKFSSLRQGDLSLDFEVAGDAGSACAGLASADGDGVFAGCDDWIAEFGDHPRVLILQFEMHGLASAGVKMHALESTESFQRCARNIRELEVKLNHFIACHFSGVGHGYGCIDRLPGVQWMCGNIKSAVGELCIAEAVCDQHYFLSALSLMKWVKVSNMQFTRFMSILNPILLPIEGFDPWLRSSEELCEFGGNTMD